MSLLTMPPPMLSDLPTSTGSQMPQQTIVNAHNNSPNVPSTSSLLFGFLISFLALFITLMGCGLATRYVRDRRRQRLATESDLLVVTQRCRKPALWDVWAVPGHGKWEDMMPLSVELRTTSPSPPASLDRRQRELSYAEQFLYQRFGREVWYFASPLRRTPSRNDVPQASRPNKVEEPVDLQVAVLIAMPSPTSRSRKHTCAINGRDTPLDGEEHSQDKSSMSDVAVGVTAIPWDKDRMDFG
ncbi:hypothetical protein JB92DRAFT_3011186 [Gautieria morchelliformis]|nr:hypothetical protein JB92DRAFT_3011186 [Gautieria morchelliformis]